MLDLQALLKASAAQHRGHLCPRQVLGVRVGMYVADLLGLEMPRTDKRLFAFVETDGCLIDGITAATGCACGHRTMRIIDYGKPAVTFVDTQSDRALRIWPSRDSRRLATRYAPEASDHWHAQLLAYQLMPNEELLRSSDVVLTVSLKAIISKHGERVVCEQCGEDIINERQVTLGGKILCRACGGDAYYEWAGEPVLLPVAHSIRA